MSESNTRGQKRKGGISNQLAAEEKKKKTKKTKSADPANPPQPELERPAPRPTNRILKAQLAASGRKPVSVSESGAAIETAEEQVATRKRPAEVDAAHEAPGSGPPSKKVRVSDTNVNKTRPLRHTGSFFASEVELKC